MDFIVEAVANAVNTAMNWQHIQGVWFVFGGITLFAGLLWGPPLLAGMIDAPPPEPHVNDEFDKDEQPTLEDILTYGEMPPPLPPAPNIPVPSIWGHPDTVSYTPGKPWNQALTLRQSNPPVQADPLAAIWSMAFFAAGLIWLVQACCCKRPKLVAAVHDDNTRGNPVKIAMQDAGSLTDVPIAPYASLTMVLQPRNSRIDTRPTLPTVATTLSNTPAPPSADATRDFAETKSSLQEAREGPKSTSASASDHECLRKLQGQRNAARTQAIELKTKIRALEEKVQGLEETVGSLKFEKKDGKAAHDRTADELGDALRQNRRLEDDIEELAKKNSELQKKIDGNPIYADVQSVFKEQLDSVKERDVNETKKLELSNNEKAREIKNLNDENDKLKRKLQEAQYLKDEAEGKVLSRAQGDAMASTESSEEIEMLQVRLDSALTRNESLEQQLSISAVENSSLETQVATLHDQISSLQTQNDADMHTMLDEVEAKSRSVAIDVIAQQQHVQRLEATIKNQDARLAAEKADSQALISEVQQQLEKVKKAAFKNYHDANIQTDTYETETTKLQVCEEGRKRDSEELKSEREAKDALQKQVKDLQQQVKLREDEGNMNDSRHKKDVEESEKKVKALNLKIQYLEEECEIITEERNESVDELAVAEKTISELEKDAAGDNDTIKELQDQQVQDRKRLEDLKAEVEVLRKELEARQIKLDDCEALIRKLKGDAKYISALQQQIVGLQTVNEDLHRQVNDMQGKLSDCESRSKQLAEEPEEAKAKQLEVAKPQQRGSMTPDVQPENSGTEPTGVNDSTPAAAAEGTSSNEEDAKQDEAPANEQALDKPSDTSPQYVGTSAQDDDLTASQMPLRDSETAAPDLQGMGTRRPAPAKLDFTSPPNPRKKLDATRAVFTPRSGPGSSIPSGMRTRPHRTPQSGIDFSASRPPYTPPPTRTSGTTPGVPNTAPAGPNGKNTCSECEASFTDAENWRFTLDHLPKCREWRKVWEPKSYVKEGKGKYVTKFPPHWTGPYTQQPAHDPEWKTTAERVQGEELEKKEQSSRMTRKEEKEQYAKLRAQMDNAGTEIKGDDQNKKEKVEEKVEENDENDDRGKEEPMVAVPKDDNMEGTILKPESKPKPSLTPAKSLWGEDEDDSELLIQTPPWKVRERDMERSNPQGDDEKPEQMDETTTDSKSRQGRGNDKKAGPPPQPSTPRTVESPIGNLTFTLNQGGPLSPLKTRTVKANQNSASPSASANETPPAESATSGPPQNLEITKWALLELPNLLPEGTDEKSSMQIIRTALSLEPAQAATHLHSLLGESEQAVGFITSFNNKRNEEKQSKPARSAQQGGMGTKNPYEGKLEKKQRPPPRSPAHPLPTPPTTDQRPTQDQTQPICWTEPLPFVSGGSSGAGGLIKTLSDNGRRGRGRGRGQNGARGGSLSGGGPDGDADRSSATGQSRGSRPVLPARGAKKPARGQAGRSNDIGQSEYGRGHGQNEPSGGSLSGGGPDGGADRRDATGQSRNGTVKPSPGSGSRPILPARGARKP